MVFINGKFFLSGGQDVGPWTTDQEIKAIVKASKRQDVTAQDLTDARTACREYLAQADPLYRRPFTAAA